MAYNLTILQTEAQYRALYNQTYCNTAAPIITHDGITVKFPTQRFDHAFFESSNRNGVKDAFSVNRSQRILWIKQTLEDPTSDLRHGWDSKKKRYIKNSRVAIVQGDYVVIINMKDAKNAVFITAYVADNSIGKIQGSPKWGSI